MRAAFFERHGGPEVLTLGELPTPTPSPGSVRIRVRACALNHLDLWVREGWKGLHLELPHIPCSDVVGEVDAVGSEISDLPPGTPVVVAPGVSCGACAACLSGQDHACRHYGILGETRNGGAAEFICVPRANVLPMPPGLSFEEAAAVPLAFLTSWEMLVNRARLLPGETVLVHAAGSGIGSAAIQIAKLLGARVLATAGSQAKLEQARALGADALIDYETSDFLAEVKRLTDGRGVEVVFEHLGEKTFGKSLASLARGGRLVTCGATSGSQVALDLKPIFWKRLSILGSTMGSRADLFRILQLVGEKRLHPVVDRVYPLAQVRDALERMSHREQFGKIILIPPLDR